MHPATYEPEQIVGARLALQAEGRNIAGFALRNQVDGGNPARLRQIWDEYQASRNTVVIEPIAELLVEVAEEVKAVSAALSKRITQLAAELNDKTVRAIERWVAKVTRTAGEQTAQAERELVDAAQTVDDLEEELNGLQDGYDRLTLALESRCALRQQQGVEMAQLEERPTTAEEDARQREERYQGQRTVLQDTLNTERTQHKNTREDLQKQLGQISAEANAHTEELEPEHNRVNTLPTHLGSQENALVSERQQHRATRETLRQRLEQAVADAQARAGELALERDRVSSLTVRLESQEKTSSERPVRMDSGIASLTDHRTQLENQHDDVRLEMMGEKGTVVALRGEAEALKHQNQSLMATFSGSKQTGGQSM